MELKQEDNYVGQKIDKINTVISHMLKEISDSRCESEKFSLVSPFDSFCEDFTEYQNPISNFPIQAQNVPTELLQKIQDLLTENEHLFMKLEDLTAQWSRSAESLIEIPITQEQLLALSKDTEKLLRENSHEAVIKIAKNFFILEPRNKQDKVLYFTDEVKSHKLLNSSQEIEEPKSLSIIDSDKDLKILKLQSELEIKYLEIGKKEENIRRLEEELGYKIQKLETLKNEYISKLADLNSRNSSCENTPNKSKRTCSCSDQSQNYSLNSSLQSSPKDLYNTFSVLDTGSDQSEQPKSFLEDPDLSFSKSEVTVRLDSQRPSQPGNLLYLGNFSSKERYILNYLKDQSKYYEDKVKELQEYESYLQEAWVESFGHSKAVYALQKASYKNFQISLQLKKDREILDEKTMRLQKLHDLTSAENTRLEFHRKKIWNERQALIRQQNEIEDAFSKILNLR